MDPITLHFSVFQASCSSQGRQSLQVDDPRSKTIGALKRELFSDALEAQRSVRFIAGGKILEDSSLLASYNLGRESHICVSISDQTPRLSPTLAPAAEPVEVAPEDVNVEDWWPSIHRFAGFAALISSAVCFYCAWHKRRQLSIQLTQALCIGAAVWVYLLLFHAVPCACQVLAGGFGAPKVSLAPASTQRAARSQAQSSSPAATLTDQATVLVGSSSAHGSTSTAAPRTRAPSAAAPSLQL
eukprot:TRINITY_DN26854_c0_g1_i2.p1 TRINITY_DN26854_c0_g1~~TRINITY_DN26854_c0_g1_i2.p1  ORF type:complete len:242 (+),score=46.75 TRINITY_DN26854_c0_g1_i2:81-806(+)